MLITTVAYDDYSIKQNYSKLSKSVTGSHIYHTVGKSAIKINVRQTMAFVNFIYDW